jgi:Protein of unknown function (DUF935)
MSINTILDEIKAKVSMPIRLMPRDTSTKGLDDLEAAIDIALSVFQPISKPIVDVYRNITSDVHLWSLMEQRIGQIINIRWAFKVKGEVHDEINDLTKKYFFQKILRAIIESKLYGFSMGEVDFKKMTYYDVPREYVVPVKRAVLQNPWNYSSGILIDQKPFLGSTLFVGEDWDLGILYRIAVLIILKKAATSDWANFIEIFGMPTRVYYFDPDIPGNYEETTKQAAITGSNAYAVLPKGSDMKQESVQGKAGNEIYQKFVEYVNSEVSIGVVGQNMTTSDGSSLAQGKVHAATEDAINSADRSFVQKILNEEVTKLLVAQGFNVPDGGEFIPDEDDEELSTEQQLNIDLLIHEKVGKLPLSYFAEKYNVEFDPNQPEPVEQNPEPQNPKDKQAKQKKDKTEKKSTLKKLAELLENSFFA